MSVLAESLDSPAVTMHRLAEIELDLALRQNPWERLTGQWVDVQRAIRKAHATALLSSDKASVTEKRAEAELAALMTDGAELEAEYESSKAVIEMLTKRSMILMSLLKTQGRS
jgi:hypothetical protein